MYSLFGLMNILPELTTPIPVPYKAYGRIKSKKKNGRSNSRRAKRRARRRARK
jgi:hypothetical protein